MWTKRRLIEAAFGELALAGYTYDLTPEEVQAALLAMEAMASEWVNNGAELSYSFGEDVDAVSGVSLPSTRAVYLNLAISIAASKGKQLSRQTLVLARNGYDAILTNTVKDATASAQQEAANTPTALNFWGHRGWTCR